ncbi:hypothetical protein ACTZWW_13825 [Salinarimonas sp. NSM]|uniref:hypothetical protein n=1 Tax=Salinarimonas sp. NSM TaxID=3458003 RepID=UPI004035EC08
MSEGAPERFPTDEDIRRAVDLARRVPRASEPSKRPDWRLGAIYEILGPDGVTRTRIAPGIMERALRGAGRASR